MERFRAGTDRASGTPSRPEGRPLAIPKGVLEAGSAVALAWAMREAGVEQDAGEIDEEAYRQQSGSLDEARDLARTLTYEVVGGRPGGYRGDVLFDALPEGHETVRALCTIVRCIAYEKILQARVPDLTTAVALARGRADEGALAAQSEEWSRYQQQVDELLNNPRSLGDSSSAIRPVRLEPDRSEERKLQQKVDALAAEIVAVRQRKQAAGARVGTTFRTMAEAAATLTWVGPSQGPTPAVDDWTEMYAAYDQLAEIAGKRLADDLMDTAVKRFGR